MGNQQQLLRASTFLVRQSKEMSGREGGLFDRARAVPLDSKGQSSYLGS